MNSKPIRHEDERRVLTEFISDTPFKRAKVIETKGKVTLGKHYHNKSDSVFYIVRGKGNYVLKNAYYQNAKVTRDWLFEGESLFVPKGVIHTFNLFPGTIMVETASEPYEKEDEIRVED